MKKKITEIKGNEKDFFFNERKEGCKTMFKLSQQKKR